ncbi:hypothetical protein DYB31_009542 [Aphanomyces astaci]|uniref:FYVE-type domain-containing protein n=1 Tax=Aphanomyces astaci TaxID=112090 RepID=A0A397FKC3_APHAT|nr:hypothetical protein DYB31_009542 [Aphanomyces astaci]
MADPTTTAAAAAATTTVLRPPTPISPRPLTPTSPAAAPTDGSPTQRVLGAFFPDSDDTLSSVHECPVCLRPFSLVRFKHRCKACDRNVCNDCSKSRLRLDDMGLDGPHMPKRGQLRKDRGHKSSRVCDPCARSYFESKLDADYLSTTPPRVVEDTPRAPVAMADGGSSPSLSQHPTSSNVPPSYTTLVARSSSSCKWLRRRHFVFFGVFSFGLVLRLVFRLLHLMNVPGTFLCVDAIHRLTRLDVFAVGLLVLIAVDEWLAFQHTRSLKTNQRNGRPFVAESDTPLASKGADESAAARILRDKSNDHTQNASNEDDEIHDDVRLDKLGLVLTTSFNQGSVRLV